LKIFKKITDSFSQKKPFVAYRFPNKNQLKGVFQQDDVLHTIKDFTEKGFVFAPFNSAEETIYFPLEKAVFIEEKLPFLSAVKKTLEEKKEDDLAKEIYLNLIQKSIHFLKANNHKKVVLSRKEMIENNDFSLIETFKNLLQTYKNAFVYVWYHPKVGLWMGATPEKLVSIRNNHFTTVALAGTQPYLQLDKVIWQKKEEEEQQFVTDFLVENLSSISDHLIIGKRKTVKAGNLVHLKTEISGDLQEDFSLQKVLHLLHPTPAVCGLPKEKAKAFILKTEDYHRNFYTGFLGELNFDTNKSSSLFVNLRCMEIDKKMIGIYVGGGITQESVPLKEWQETVAKSKVMKSVL